MDFSGLRASRTASCYKITPPNLVATMVSATASVLFILGIITFYILYKKYDLIERFFLIFTGRGLGGLIGGQLNSALKLSLPQVFYVISVTVATMSIATRIMYKFFGQKYEDQLDAERKRILEEIERNNSQSKPLSQLNLDAYLAMHLTSQLASKTSL